MSWIRKLDLMEKSKFNSILSPPPQLHKVWHHTSDPILLVNSRFLGLL